MAANKLLSVKEASKYLGMSEAWVLNNPVPCVRLGRRRLYRTEDLDTFVARRVRR